MPKIVRVSKTAIDNLTMAAEQLPAKEPSDFVLKDAIEKLIPTIENLQTKGYSLVEINTLLAENQIAIGINTLKQYIAEFSKKPTRKKSPAKSPKQTTSQSSDILQTETESPKTEVDRSAETTTEESRADLNIPKLANTEPDEAPINNASSGSASLMSKLKSKP